MVSVTREHENFTEVLLPSDPLFQEAQKTTWGGRRPGAGRPKTGAMPSLTISKAKQIVTDHFIHNIPQ